MDLIRVPNRGSSGHVQIVTACGSLMLEAASVPDGIGRDAAILADVGTEVARVRRGNPSLSVVLGRGHTTTTLVAAAAAINPKFTQMLRELSVSGPVDLEAGLGMLSFIGDAAFEVAVREQNLRTRIEDEIVIPLLQQNNGTIRRVAITYINSIAGGTGAIAGPRLAGLLADIVRELTPAVIDLQGLQVGAMTFIGLGKRVFSNAAAAICEQIAAARQPSHERESAGVVFIELPSVDTRGRAIARDRDVRGALACAVATAFGCTALQSRIKATASNRAVGDLNGRITLARADWRGALPGAAVIGAAARHYARELDNFSGVGEESNRREMSVAFRVVRQPVASVDELITSARGAGQRKPGDFDREAFSPIEFSASVLYGSSPVDRLISTYVEAAARRGPWWAAAALDSMRERVTTRKSALGAELVGAARVFKDASARLTAAIEARFPQRWQALFASALAGVGRLNMRLRDGVTAFRSAAERHARLEAEIRALNEVVKLIDAESGRARAAVARLRSTMLDLAVVDRDEAFTFEPFATVGPEMARALARGDVGLLRSLLTQSVSNMTAEGLRELIGATDASPSAIAAALLGPALYKGPGWGGTDPARPPFLHATVLPPLPAQLVEEITGALREAACEHEVVTADNVSAGAGVVTLELYELSGVAELFTPMYVSALRDVVGRQAVLYPLSEEARRVTNEILGIQGESCGASAA